MTTMDRTAEQQSGEKLALTWHEVCRMVGLGRTSLTKLISIGEFPRPRRLPHVHKHLFDASEVRAWWQRQQEAR